MSNAGFDQFADSYDAHINRALSISGETKDYFARARVQWLAKRLRQSGIKPRIALDYGCGIGDTTYLLLEDLGLKQVIGLDVSARSVELASLHHSSAQSSFQTFEHYVPQGNVDLVYCNGVFHHIPIEQRTAALHLIQNSLAPGGIFALWENNPWNPGTRYVMSKCDFDRDAVTIPPWEGARMVRQCGFQIIRRDFLFFYPRLLSVMRFTERWMTWFPLGAQYLVLCRKPVA